LSDRAHFDVNKKEPNGSLKAQRLMKGSCYKMSE